MKVILWTAVTAWAVFCVLVTTLGMCADALAGRYPAAAWGALATLGACAWVGNARRRWRAAVAGYSDAQPQRERLP
jgi:hypothetical protein